MGDQGLPGTDAILGSQTADDGAEHLAQNKGGVMQRGFSKMTVGGVRQSTLALVSTAVGSGVLSVSYVMCLSGIGFGSIMVCVGGASAYLSTVLLMQLRAETGLDTYSAIFAHCVGSSAGPILDILIFVFGNGVCVSFLVFLGDFIPDLVAAVPGHPDWAASRHVAILASAFIVAPAVVQKDTATLRHIAPLSIVALMYVTFTVAAKAPFLYSSQVAREPEHSQVTFFKFDLQLFEAFSMCVFMYNCHLNVVPVAANLIEPTMARIQKVSGRVNLLQVAFYLLMGFAGYLSFLDNTPEDILTGYEMHDISIAVGRVLLSLTLFVALPSNSIPTTRSGLQFVDVCRRRCTGRQTFELQSSATSMSIWRISVALGSLVVQVLIAISVPGVAVVITLMGAVCATPIMLFIPAYCAGVALPKSVGIRATQMALYTIGILSFASGPITMMRKAGMLG